MANINELKKCIYNILEEYNYNNKIMRDIEYNLIEKNIIEARRILNGAISLDKLSLKTIYILSHELYKIDNTEIENPDKYFTESEITEFYKNSKQLKKDFINERISNNRNTIMIYEKILNKAKRFEKQWNKDLSEFTYEELCRLFSFLNASTITSLYTQHNLIKRYIQYAINKGHGNALGINYAEKFTVTDLQKYVNKIKSIKQIITKKDLLDIIKTIDQYGGNAQDYTPLVLIFNGVWGRNLEELINLQLVDINIYENIITLTKNNGDKRNIKIDSEWIKYILHAFYEKDYVVLRDIDQTKFQKRKLAETPYILKGYIKFQSKITPQLIRQRIVRVKKFWGNEYITPKSILNSGIIHYTKEYIKKLDRLFLTTKDYQYITQRFGMNINNWFAIKKIIKKYVENID